MYPNSAINPHPPEKMADILQPTFEMKCIFFCENGCVLIQMSLKYVCLPVSNYQQSSIGSNNGLAPNRRLSIIWTNADPVHRRVFAALEGDRLIEL